MKASIVSKLETLSERLQEIHALLSDPATHRDQGRFRDYSKEYAQLNPVVECFHRYQATLEQIAPAAAGDWLPVIGIETFISLAVTK